MQCKHCHLPIRANEGEARPDFPWVHYDGFIHCDKRINSRFDVAFPAELESVS
jgi:hypothetical protein